MPTKPKSKAKPKKEASQEKLVQIPLDEDRDLTAVYANFVRTHLTFWDIKLQFGQISPGEKGGARAKEVVRLYMSPMHAKATLELLKRQVAEYEKRFGEIPLPEKIGFHVEEAANIS